MIRWLLLIIALIAAWHWWPVAEVKRAPGVLAPAAPVQQGVRNPAARLAKAGYEIEPLARFEFEARVLGVERYRFDRGADLSPMDVALGWRWRSSLSREDTGDGSCELVWVERLELR